MDHEIRSIKSFRIVGPYCLEVSFEDSSKQTIDFSSVLHGEMYGPLHDLAFFNQVRLDPEVHTLIWPNGADFDPAILYNWEKYSDEFARKAKSWGIGANTRS